MARLKTLFVFCLLASACFGQASVAVHFEKHSQGFWGRYAVITKTSQRAGWMVSRDGAEVNVISDIPLTAETRFKAILYAPGCAWQTVDMALAEGKTYDYFFPCEAVKQVDLEGVIVQNSSFGQMKTVIDAKYIAPWASSFFGYDDGTTTEIPLSGFATMENENHFNLPIPDFGNAKEGEIRIWMRNANTGRIYAQLRVSPQSPSSRRTRLGGIPLTALDSKPLLFNFCTITNSVSNLPHNVYGFAQRVDVPNECEP